MTADWFFLVLASLVLLVGLCALGIYSKHKWLTAYGQAYAAMQRGLEMPPEGLDPTSRDRRQLNDATLRWR